MSFNDIISRFCEIFGLVGHDVTIMLMLTHSKYYAALHLCVTYWFMLFVCWARLWMASSVTWVQHV